MQELPLVRQQSPTTGGGHPAGGGNGVSGNASAVQAHFSRRDFVDVMWQIAEKRSCDEVYIRYDCGHCIKAEIWVPCLPKTREYTNQEADRCRFMQHSIFVLTKNPGAPKVQITVPEGRCRHCGRGQRQSLICGPLHMELDERAACKRQTQGDGTEQQQLQQGRTKGGGGRGNGGAPQRTAQTNGQGSAGNSGTNAPATVIGSRRLELPLSSQVFLAAMGQVCRLPENVTPPPLLQDSSVLQSNTLKSFDGPPLSREGLHQWTRKEIEGELKAEVVKCVGGATFLLIFVVIECLYLCVIHFGSTPSLAAGGSRNMSHSISVELQNLTSVSSLEMGVANSTWVLSALTLAVHKAFGPADSGTGRIGASWWWSIVVHPLWMLISAVLAPILWILDLVVALPRFLLLHVVFALVHTLIWRPWSWLFSILWEVISSSVPLLLRCILSRPTAVLLQIPMTNPMVVAMALSILVAALSAPQPPSLPLPGLWSEVQSSDLARKIRRLLPRSKLVQRIQALWASAQREARPRGGLRGVPTTRGQKEKAQDRRGDRAPDSGNGRAERGAQVGRGQESRMQSGGCSTVHSAPACFVCLERPSRYILEPCGHRVVCGECATQLVEAAARNRSAGESVAHHMSEKSGGACPSCGQAITRVMRVFS